MARCIVLLGPPGSGKSTVGAALGGMRYRWREWEPVLLARWGNVEAFVANKQTALAEHHAELLAWVREDGPPAVLETTGISDAEFLDSLAAETNMFVARLDADVDDVLRRVRERAANRHLSDEVERTRATWQAFQQLVVPRRIADMVIDTSVVTPENAASLIDRAFTVAPA